MPARQSAPLTIAEGVSETGILHKGNFCLLFLQSSSQLRQTLSLSLSKNGDGTL